MFFDNRFCALFPESLQSFRKYGIKFGVAVFFKEAQEGIDTIPIRRIPFRIIKTRPHYRRLGVSGIVISGTPPKYS